MVVVSGLEVGFCSNIPPVTNHILNVRKIIEVIDERKDAESIKL